MFENKGLYYQSDATDASHDSVLQDVEEDWVVDMKVAMPSSLPP